MSSSSIFLDYCLTCNRQIEAAAEVYCSQQCRLADLCSPNTSSSSTVPPTPCTQQSSTSHNHSTSVASTSSMSSQRHSTHFVLPPAYDFSSHRNSTVSVASSSPSNALQMTAPPAPRPSSGYFAYAGTNNVLLSSSEAAKKTLSPTSSRSSITSMDDVRAELRMYESGFDQVRDWRRRRASVYENTWKN